MPTKPTLKIREDADPQVIYSETSDVFVESGGFEYEEERLIGNKNLR